MLLAILGMVAYQWISHVPPQLTAEQMQMRLVAQRNAHLRWQVFWWMFTAGLSLAALGGGYYVVVLAKNSRERIYADPVTGLWPITREDRAPWWERLRGNHDWIEEDPNLAIAPTRRIHANGKLTVQADLHGASFNQQIEYAAKSWTVQRAIAATGGGMRPNAAMLKDAAGVFDAEARRKNLLADATAQRVQAALPETSQATTEPHVTLTDRMALDWSQDGIVYIGQASDRDRTPATWDSNQAATLGIFGANGTGKTTTVATMVTLAMVRWGWKLWILDGKDAGDWDEFGNHTNVVPINRSTIGDAIQQIWDEYQQREQMMSQYRARHYRHLPSDVQAQFPQWGFVFEEYGATRLALPNKMRAQLDKFVNILCQKARYTGWHGVFIDQRPTDYTDEMKGNLKAIACFKMLMNQGHAVNAYEASKLSNRGEFEMDGQRYWAFYAEPLAVTELRTLPVRVSFATVRKPSVDGSQAFVGGSVMNAIPAATNGSERHVQEANEETVHMNGGEGEGSNLLVSIYERSRSWDAVAEEFFKQSPEGTQSELRKIMAEIADDGRSPDVFKGEANRLYHAYSPHGNNRSQPQTVAEQLQALGYDPADIRLPGGDKIGVDVTTGR